MDSVDDTAVEIRHLRKASLKDLLPFSHQRGSPRFRINGETINLEPRIEFLKYWLEAITNERCHRLSEINLQHGSEAITEAKELAAYLERNLDNYSKLSDASYRDQHVTRLCARWGATYRRRIEEDQTERLRRAAELQLSLHLSAADDPTIAADVRSMSVFERRNELEYLESEAIQANLWRLTIAHEIFCCGIEKPLDRGQKQPSKRAGPTDTRSGKRACMVTQPQSEISQGVSPEELRLTPLGESSQTQPSTSNDGKSRSQSHPSPSKTMSTTYPALHKEIAGWPEAPPPGVVQSFSNFDAGDHENPVRASADSESAMPIIDSRDPTTAPISASTKSSPPSSEKTYSLPRRNPARHSRSDLIMYKNLRMRLT